MHDISSTMTAIGHVVYARLRAFAPEALLDDDREPRDRGAVSLEQALWYAAAAVSVGVVATIIWNAIRDQANTGVQPGGL